MNVTFGMAPFVGELLPWYPCPHSGRRRSSRRPQLHTLSMTMAARAYHLLSMQLSQQVREPGEFRPLYAFSLWGVCPAPGVLVAWGTCSNHNGRFVVERQLCRRRWSCRHFPCGRPWGNAPSPQLSQLVVPNRPCRKKTEDFALLDSGT